MYIWNLLKFIITIWCETGHTTWGGLVYVVISLECIMWWGYLCLCSKGQMGTALMGKDNKCHGLGWTHMAGIKWEMVEISWEGFQWTRRLLPFRRESRRLLYTGILGTVWSCCSSGPPLSRERGDWLHWLFCLFVGFTFSLLPYFPPSHTHTSLGGPPKRQAV